MPSIELTLTRMTTVDSGHAHNVQCQCHWEKLNGPYIVSLDLNMVHDGSMSVGDVGTFSWEA